MGFKLYIKLVLKRFWIIILLEIIAIASTIYFTESQPITYTAKSTIIINPRVPNSLVPYAGGDLYYVTNLAENYNLIIKSDKFATKVAQQVGFPTTGDAVKGTYSSKLVTNSLFFNITATSNTAEKAQKIANTVTSLFLSEGITQSGSDLTQPVDIVSDTIKRQRDELKSLQTEIDKLKDNIAQLQKQATPDDKSTETLKNLQTQLKDNLDLQSKLVTSISDVESKDTSTVSRASASLVDEARLPISPDARSLSRNLIFAAALALALGISLIVLLDYLDYTVRSSDELAKLTGYTTLGIIPVIRSAGLVKDPKAAGEAADSSVTDIAGKLGGEIGVLNSNIVTAIEFKTAGAESYRALRTNILFSTLGRVENQNSRKGSAVDILLDDGDDKEFVMRSLMVTSAIPKEGKSLTSANLAVAFAQAGSRVILVDADMRQPTLHKLFGIKNENGFSDMLLSRHVPVKSTSIPNLYIVTAGTIPPNPSELLTNKRTTKVINALCGACDLVILDSPPTVLVSDAAILANRVDRVLLVARSGSTRRDAILKAAASLRKVGANVLGTVLNRVDQKDDGGYYYYEYGGYVESSKKKRNKASREKSGTPS